MALPLFKDPLGLAPLLALATLVAVGVLRWPLYWALGGLDSAERRDRLGAAMKDDGGTLLTLAGYFAGHVAVRDRRGQFRGAGNAAGGGRGRGLDDRFGS